MTTEVPSAATTGAAGNILSREYRWTTIGAFALVFLGAFESLAVTTIMPTISRDLDGEALYSLAFSGTLATSVVGMVVAGGWADRRGPARPLVTAILVFLLGLILSGIAVNMELFIAGRLLQGLGSGAVNVCLAVVVARIYPPALHPKVFGAFAAAWVLPSMIGPPVAGVVADTLSWHWVFLGVGVLVLFASGTILPAIKQLWFSDVHEPDAAPTLRNIVLSVVVAVGVIAVSVGPQVVGALTEPKTDNVAGSADAVTTASSSPLTWLVAGLALVIVVVAIRPLVPRGTLIVRRGLPATVLLRGAVAAAFFATEVYLPYFLSSQYGLETWASGLILTVGAVSWALGSAVQGRYGERISNDAAVRAGALLLVVGIGVQFATAFFLLSPIVAAAGWFLAGGGMGLIFPRISTLVLAYSTPRDQGFNSSAMSITDASGAATSIAFAGLLFAAFGSATNGGGFVAALALSSVLALIAVPIALRVRA